MVRTLVSTRPHPAVEIAAAIALLPVVVAAAVREPKVVEAVLVRVVVAGVAIEIEALIAAAMDLQEGHREAHRGEATNPARTGAMRHRPMGRGRRPSRSVRWRPSACRWRASRCRRVRRMGEVVVATADRIVMDGIPEGRGGRAVREGGRIGRCEWAHRDR